MKGHLITLTFLFIPFLGVSQSDVRELIMELRFEEAKNLAQSIIKDSNPGNEDYQLALYHLGVCQLNLGELDAALQTFVSGLSLDSGNHSKYFKGLAMVQHEGLNFDSALFYYEKAIQITDRNDEFYIQLLVDKGDLLMAKEQYKKASALFFQAKELYDQKETQSPYLAYLVHLYIGEYYLIKNDYQNAELNLKLALSIGNKIFNPDHPKMTELHESLGLTYINLEDKERMLFHYERVYDINKKGKAKGSYDLIVANNIMGMSLLNAKDYREAAKYLILAYDDMASYFPQFDLGVHIVGMNLGITYYQLNEYQLAIEYLSEAVEAGRKAYGAKAQSLGEALGYLAQAYEDFGDQERALKIYNEAIKSNSLLQSEETLNEYTEIVDVETLSFILQNRAQFYLKRYLSTRDISLLELARRDADLNLTILQNHQQSLPPESRSSLSYELDFSYYLAVEINWHYHQIQPENQFLENILNNIERSKSDYLRVSLSLAETKSTANTPDEILKLEADLQMEKEELKAKIIAGENQGSTTLPWDSLVQVHQRIDSIRAVIQQLVNDKYVYQWRKLEDLQNKLGSNEAILDFMYREGILMQIIITGDEIIVTRDSVDLLKEQVITFRDEIQSISEEFSTRKTLSDLLANKLDNLPTTINKLTIIPDGVLHYVPFELLGDEQTYLLEKYDITYANFLREPAQKGESNNRLLSFAPDFGIDQVNSLDVVRSDLASIPGALEEIDAINNLFGGETMASAMATETSFKKNAKDFGIIHMATHAIVDDSNPELSRMVFNISGDTLNDGYLHAYEIYNLDLNAMLVTLSACNTGYGRIDRGEGVMSLSWAFAYAGVASTVVSLWPASDKSTPELMKYFYQNLKDGQAKDEALNNARKQYLATAEGKARHPFYWGGFVLIGDNNPIEDTNLLVYLIPSILVIVLILTVYRRKNALNTFKKS
ncbi:CHAT domain-containing protein [Ekhidna sp.]|uniref:CHAT domain-containing protein n=1 Tax=Ekhidna sp. TaxID=2608089 RepID=UPI00329967AE